jgi:hypothetical protein
VADARTKGGSHKQQGLIDQALGWLEGLRQAKEQQMMEQGRAEAQSRMHLEQALRQQQVQQAAAQQQGNQQGQQMVQHAAQPNPGQGPQVPLTEQSLLHGMGLPSLPKAETMNDAGALNEYQRKLWQQWMQQQQGGQ